VVTWSSDQMVSQNLGRHPKGFRQLGEKLHVFLGFSGLRLPGIFYWLGDFVASSHQYNVCLWLLPYPWQDNQLYMLIHLDRIIFLTHSTLSRYVITKEHAIFPFYFFQSSTF